MTVATQEVAPSSCASSLADAYRKFSYVWSSCLLAFAVVIMYYGISQDWVNDFDDNGARLVNVTGLNVTGTLVNGELWTAHDGADNTHIAINLTLVTLFIFWIALLEGAQVSIVGLSTVDIETFKGTHPQSYEVCKIVHAGANVERFIVGRQFLILFVVFLTTRMAGHSKNRVLGTEDFGNNEGHFSMWDWDWHENADLVFMQNSILLMLVIIIPAQLVSQLLALPKMLDFLELPFLPKYTVVYPSLAFEFIGLTHCAYFIKDMASRATGMKDDAGDGHQMEKNTFYWVRVFYSCVAVVFSIVVVVKGLLDGQTAVWDTLPGYGALLMCIFFLFFIGCCEGFQIAVMKLAKLPTSQLKEKYPAAHKNVQLLFTGRNSQSFMIGRQVFVAMMMVLLGRVTSFKDREDDVFGFPMWFKDGFLTTGILGAIFVVNVGQLSFRMLASAFPVIFLNNYVMYVLLRIALIVEATGVVNAAWPLTWALDYCLGLRPDPFDIDDDDDDDEGFDGGWVKQVRRASMAGSQRSSAPSSPDATADLNTSRDRLIDVPADDVEDGDDGDGDGIFAAAMLAFSGHAAADEDQDEDTTGNDQAGYITVDVSTVATHNTAASNVDQTKKVRELEHKLSEAQKRIKDLEEERAAAREEALRAREEALNVRERAIDTIELYRVAQPLQTAWSSPARTSTGSSSSASSPDRLSLPNLQLKTSTSI